MATPALRAVRDRFSASEIVGVMRPYVADVLAGTKLIDRELIYNPRGQNRLQRGLPFVRALRAERFDAALLLPNSLRSGVMAWLSGARQRVGFARDLRGWLLTKPVTPKSKSNPHPVMDEYLRLAVAIGCAPSRPPIELALSAGDQSRFDTCWTQLRAAQKNSMLAPSPGVASYVCLNTGGAFGGAKNWPRESFSKLARRIATELHKTVLIVCGPAERDDARWIADAAGHPNVISLADAELSIGLTKAAIRGADLLVTTDSGPRHFAAAFSTPVITLFGPTHIAWSETDYSRAEHLQLKLDCGPCQQRECPLNHHRCMRELSVETVFSAVLRQIGKYKSIPKSA